MHFTRVTSLLMALAATALLTGGSPPAQARPEVSRTEAAKILAPDLGCGTTPATLLGRTAAPQRRSAQPLHRQEEAEPLPTLRRAFYTCTRTPMNATPIGAGWLAIGPILRG